MTRCDCLHSILASELGYQCKFFLILTPTSFSISQLSFTEALLLVSIKQWKNYEIRHHIEPKPVPVLKHLPSVGFENSTQRPICHCTITFPGLNTITFTVFSFLLDLQPLLIFCQKIFLKENVFSSECSGKYQMYNWDHLITNRHFSGKNFNTQIEIQLLNVEHLKAIVKQKMLALGFVLFFSFVSITYQVEANILENKNFIANFVNRNRKN